MAATSGKHFCRYIRPSDLSAVLELDREVNQWDAMPESFFDEISLANTRPGILLEDDGRVVAFLLYYNHPDSLQILRLTVAFDQNRAALARRLLKGSITVARSRELQQLTANIHERELGLQLAFRDCGYRCIEIYPQAGFDGEDLYRFAWFPGVEDVFPYSNNSRINGLT